LDSRHAFRSVRPFVMKSTGRVSTTCPLNAQVLGSPCCFCVLCSSSGNKVCVSFALPFFVSANNKVCVVFILPCSVSASNKSDQWVRDLAGFKLAPILAVGPGPGSGPRPGSGSGPRCYYHCYRELLWGLGTTDACYDVMMIMWRVHAVPVYVCTWLALEHSLVVPAAPRPAPC